ncbi:hypothetical protein [Cohnella sp. AR92]|uniref:hypothetical protein n=1 Tax=Cohnella sp. AR92 TaxID=648716 RepID=UPI000F8C62B7|nr:hypothetical protein [Cohnella sp. AR92]RUS44936.1 hypothetical protein ELR57_22025 [Cohnella sp. AR92]
MRQTIIIGTGNESLDELIKSDMEEANIGTVVATVTTRNSLVKRFMETEATLIFIGEELVGDEGTDEEWERIIEEMKRISLQLRIVYFCQRPADDLFLTKLTTQFVFDIFNDGQLPASYLEQLTSPPVFKNIEKFRGKVGEAAKQIAEKSKEQRAEEIISQGISNEKKEKVKDKEREKEPKTKVITQVVEREKLVHVYEQMYIQPQLIAVASAFPGAGSSILIRMLAEYLNNLSLKVGVCESPYAPYSWFELIHGAKLLIESDQGASWKSWHRQILEEESVTRGSELTANGVGYMVRHLDELLDSWDIMHTAHLVGFGRHYPILFYDLSTGLADERERIILKQANQVILVSGYDPLRVNREHKAYEETLRMIRDKVIVVANKSTSWLHKENEEGFKRAYGVNHVHQLPVIPSLPDIYMSGESFWQSAFIKGDVREQIKSVFEDIAAELLTEDLVKKLMPKESKGFFKKLAGGFRKERAHSSAELDDSPA